MRDKSQDSSLQEGVSYIYTFRLDYSKFSNLVKKKKKQSHSEDGW